MKQSKIRRNVFKCLALAGLLSACNNNDQIIAPTETEATHASGQNAKISPLLRLTNEGDRTIQYVKSGKYLGRVSSVGNYNAIDYRVEYTYDDSSAGVLWITKKKYTPWHSLEREWKFKVVNGICVLSVDTKEGTTYEYLYSAQGFIDRIKLYKNGSSIGSRKYSYNYTGSDSYRLVKITYLNHLSIPTIEHYFSYEAIPDKYPAAFEEGQGYVVDKYLPIFGKNADLLVDEFVQHSTNGAFDDKKQSYNYTIDSDGLVITKTTNGASKMLKYSTNWQGL